MDTLKKEEVRRMILCHQYLWPGRALRGPEGILAFVEQAGCLQFDPLQVIGHNHDLVLQARIRDYRPSMLRDLLYGRRRLVEGWDKQMSIYGIGDWPCFARSRAAALRRSSQSDARMQQAMEAVRREITERGPLSSLDVALPGKVDWFWAPARLARAAMENLFFAGELVVHHREHTRRVFDLAENHVPRELLSCPDPHPDRESFADWRVLRRLGSAGLLWDRGGPAWDGTRTDERRAALERLMKSGLVFECRAEGLSFPLYGRSADRQAMEAAADGKSSGGMAYALAPLDPMLWDRSFLREIFGFEYRWEVYKPRDQRSYGYYVLPVLYGQRFVARFEPVRHPSGAMMILDWWWEPGVRPSLTMRDALARCVARLARSLDLQGVLLSDAVRDKGLSFLAGES